MYFYYDTTMQRYIFSLNHIIRDKVSYTPSLSTSSSMIHTPLPNIIVIVVIVIICYHFLAISMPLYYLPQFTSLLVN